MVFRPIKPVRSIKKIEKTQIMKIRNKNEDFPTDLTEIKRIMSDYYEKLYTKKLDSLNEINKFIETCNLSLLNHEERKIEIHL